MTAARIRPILGVWWLPGYAERLPGRLTFRSDTGATLVLDGDFADLPRRAWTRPALYGESTNGKRITLLDPAWVERPPPIDGWTPPPGARTVVTSQAILRGLHVLGSQDLHVSRATVRLQGLKELCARRFGFAGRADVAFVGGESGDPREVRVDVIDGTLTFVRRRVRTSRGSSDDVAVILEPQRSVAFEQFSREWLAPIQELVIFAGRDATAIDALTVRVVDHVRIGEATDRVEPGSPGGGDAEVIMALPGLAGPPRHNYRRPLAPFAGLGQKAAPFIQNWWRVDRQMGRSAMELLISALSDRLFLENRLLNEMSFAESMHRVLHNEAPITDAEHDTYVAAMLGNVPTTAPRDGYRVRDHYKVRLKYAAGQSQRQRLKWILDRAAGVFHPDDEESDLLPDFGAGLANRLVQTRNALMHLDPAAEQPLSDLDLYRALERLEVAIQANLLLDLGLTEREVAALMRASYVNMSPFIELPNQ